MSIALTHIALHVKNVRACSEFYEQYAGMSVVHRRQGETDDIIWLAEKGKEKEFIIVLIPGGPGRNQQEKDYSHLGFAVESRARVDEIADQARSNGDLFWDIKEEPFPVGYYCGVRDPDGNIVEFSYGQPLGPGADASIVDIEHSQ